MHHSSRIISYILSFFVGALLFPHLSIAQNKESDRELAQKVQKMSLDQKVGQLFILGFSQDSLTTDLAKNFSQMKPGAFVLFKRNITSLSAVKKLNADLYDLSIKYSGLPPVIAVDQEGGNVVRIITSPPMPNALSVGQAGSAEIAQNLGRESASLLGSLGFNMNLAPVLDIASPFEFSFIGVRSFGSDPATVSKMGYAFSKGMVLGKVIPTAKHFPGTGSSPTDPHHESSVVLSSKEALYKIHLPPFQTFARLGSFTALMVSHSVYPQLGDEKTPAVFSKKIMTDLLREKMKYRGLVITDDLQMSASKSFLRPEEAALRSILAGSDMVMLTWSSALQAKAMARVKAAVKSGEFPRKLLDEKVLRIAQVKGRLNAKPVELRKLSSTSDRIIKSKAMGDIDDSILDKNLRANFNSVEKNHKSLCLISPSTHFIKSFKSGYRGIPHSKQIQRKTSTAELEKFIQSKKCDLVVYGVEGKRTSLLLRSLSQKIKERVLVANLSLPNNVPSLGQYRAVLNIYFPHQKSGQKIAQLLSDSYASIDNSSLSVDE